MQVEYIEIGHNLFLLFSYILIIHDILAAKFNVINLHTVKQTNSWALVRQWTIPTERPPLVGEVSAKFSS
jgi:hypothetical protein